MAVIRYVADHELTQWNRNRGESNRQHQGPQSKIKFKKAAGGAAGNESDHRWKSQASAAAK